VRALFFDPPLTRAWAVDLHMINTNESGANTGTRFPLVVVQNGARVFLGAGALPGGTVKASNRTLVGLGFGPEWYLNGSADNPGSKWRLGVDAGGRYGSARLDLNEARHLTDVIGSAYAAAHSDFEIPLRTAIFHAGVRVEWAYTWSDILQRSSDVQDISVLFQVGLRY
jgi:hypothetical protein